MNTVATLTDSPTPRTLGNTLPVARHPESSPMRRHFLVLDYEEHFAREWLKEEADALWQDVLTLLIIQGGSK